MGDIILSSEDYFNEFIEVFGPAVESGIFERNTAAKILLGLYKDSFRLESKLNIKQRIIKLASKSDDVEIVQTQFNFDPYDQKNMHRMYVVFMKLLSGPVKPANPEGEGEDEEAKIECEVPKDDY